MIFYFIVFSIIIIAVSRRLSSSWSVEPYSDSEDIAAEEEPSSDSMDLPSSYKPIAESVDQQTVTTPTLSSGVTPMEEEDEFDFDLRKAVLYSEIMAPKWKEYN